MDTPCSFVLKGHIVYAPMPTQLITETDSFLVCDAGKVAGVFHELPECYRSLPLIDYGDAFILPGLVDLHLHAPQYPFIGSGMDMELIPWLTHYAFVEEAKYADTDYATRAYTYFVRDLKKSPTTRAVIFGTLHVPATQILTTLLEDSGLCCYVGKVNMDRHSPSNLCESTSESLEATKSWLDTCKSGNIKPILTPRFIPSCSDPLLESLGEMAKSLSLPIQSHLSENLAEIEWVRSLHPDASCYGDAYEKYGLFGNYSPTIMAHCVYPTDRELDMMEKYQVYVAHCPQSNINLSSGIAPIRKMLDRHLSVGLGTDIAGGFSLSLFRAMCDAIQVSKLYRVLIDPTATPLTIPEVFYMGTKGGGQFFGKVGSFEAGYQFDAIILDDHSLSGTIDFSLEERLERLIYLSTPEHLIAKYVNGISIL